MSFGIDERLVENIELLSKEENLFDRFDNLLKTNLVNKTQEEILSIIHEKLIYLPLQITYSRQYNIDSYPVYRVRKNINESIESLDLVRTYSYPNSCFCSSNGRANLKHKPVFYCSDIPQTAIIESKPEVGEILYLTRWFVRCHRGDKHVCILPFNISETNSYLTIARNRYSEMTTYFEKRFGKSTSNKIKDIFNFLSYLFINENAPYSLTSCLVNSYLYNEYHGIDYIIYPSFQTKAYTCNIAFHPNFSDNFLKLDTVLKIRIQKIHETGIEMAVLKVGEYWDNSLIWRPPNERDSQFMPKFS